VNCLPFSVPLPFFSSCTGPGKTATSSVRSSTEKPDVISFSLLSLSRMIRSTISGESTAELLRPPLFFSSPLLSSLFLWWHEKKEKSDPGTPGGPSKGWQFHFLLLSIPFFPFSLFLSLTLDHLPLVQAYAPPNGGSGSAPPSFSPFLSFFFFLFLSTLYCRQARAIAATKRFFP